MQRQSEHGESNGRYVEPCMTRCHVVAMDAVDMSESLLARSMFEEKCPGLAGQT